MSELTTTSMSDSSTNGSSDDKAAVQRDDREQYNSPDILATPLRLSGVLFSRGSQHVKHVAPQLITFLVCLLLVPLVIFLSVFAGWFVWKNVAVGWEAPVYLQYG